MKFDCAAVAGIAVLGALTMTPALLAQHTGHDANTMSQQSHVMAMPSMNDAQFVELMTKHHQDGIEMAKLEESKGTRAEVKALATKIREGQEREIKEMEAAAPKDSHAAGAMPHGAAAPVGHDAMTQTHHEMMEQMGAASKKKIEDASGAAVDQAFLEEMAMHHEMAMQMATKTTFQNAELKKVAQKMAADQKRDLAELKKLQAR